MRRKPVQSATRSLTRRTFLKYTGATTLTLFAAGRFGLRRAIAAAIPGGTLDPLTVPKFVTPVLVPPVMPRAGIVPLQGGKNADYYEISVRQLQQQVLPAGFGATTVWGYGAVRSASRNGLLLHNAPSLTIEAKWNAPVRVKWINELVDAQGNYLPHLLPVDPTLHWANPPGGADGRDTRPVFEETPGPYTGPVPLVTHVHGSAGVGDESDGYAEAWFLPDAVNLPADYATVGTWYEFFREKAAGKGHVAPGTMAWEPGTAVFQYPNTQRASTAWYHDHTLGMTRLNVYAGPAGFFIIRGGPAGDDAVMDARSGARAVLPGPAPKENDRFPPNKAYYEIPLAIQDRSFNADGSLFYPDTRAFFDGIVGPYLPHGAHDGGMDGGHGMGFSPIWNPEFFGNVLMVNGNTWPFLTVERRRYRLRFLNGCQSRFLILDFAAIPGVEAWAIGNEGGFLAAPVNLTADHGNRLLLGLAERADVIVDFTNVPEGNYVLRNVGPDEPFGGGVPGVDFETADPDSTGQVMQFRVVAAKAPDDSTPPAYLVLPAIVPLPAAVRTRPLALIEEMGMGYDADGAEVEGPSAAVLGTVEGGEPHALMWMDPVSENPAAGDTEVWEFYNFTADAHPMHVHETLFQVVNRQALVLDPDTGEAVRPVQLDGEPMPPQPWESGFKDTVIAYPGQVTRVRARFGTAGQYVWHCHIVEHEDNEMMRPYRIGPVQPGQPGS
jgi:FtsP/CotA-like multicopper oxidase with cupredoxin domain